MMKNRRRGRNRNCITAGQSWPVVKLVELNYCDDETPDIITLVAENATHVVATESPIKPGITHPGWQAYPWAGPITTTSSGLVTFYFWAKKGNQISCAISATVKVVPGLTNWWEPARNMMVAESSSAALSAFTPTGLDGFPGSLPNLVESSGGTTHACACGSAASNFTTGPAHESCTLKQIGSREWVELSVEAGIAAGYVHLTDGSVGTASGTVSVTGDATAGWTVKAYGASVTAAARGTISLAEADGDKSYSGDGASGVIATNYSGRVQHRCTALADQFGVDDWAQANPASQMFVQKTDGSSPGGNSFGAGVACLWSPVSGLSYRTMTCTSAALGAMAAGSFSIVMRIVSFGSSSTTGVHLLWGDASPSIQAGVLSNRKPMIYVGGTGVVGSAISDTSPHTVGITRDGTTGANTVYFDGAKVAGPTTVAGPVTPGTAMTLGLDTHALAVCAVASGVLSDAQMAAVMGAL